MTHECTKEREINEIHSMMVALDKAIRGNGKPGLLTDLAVLKNTVVGLIGLNVILIGGLLSLWFVK